MARLHLILLEGCLWMVSGRDGVADRVSLRDMTYGDEWLRMGITRLSWERGMEDGITVWLGVVIGGLAVLACRDGAMVSHLGYIVRMCGKLAGPLDVWRILSVVAGGKGHLEVGRGTWGERCGVYMGMNRTLRVESTTCAT